jgi:phosphatidylinositol glycan class B
MFGMKKKITVGIISIYVITAIFITGYHHPDEHFQLIEFTGLKGGWNTGTDLHYLLTI